MAEHVDVLVVGAGISGVSAAYHLIHERPDTTFAILETQESFGGTWRTHTYPGIRSDSDLFTFGYKFKPWTGAPIATADKILSYMGEVIEENGIDQYIRYQHKIETATWSSDEQQWTLTGTNTATDETFEITCRFLWMCQGYYRHQGGYQPTWEGMDDFEGTIVHPMEWPDDLDYAGKRVVVIGSGATAATLIPAMAPDVEHITMLQRTPTYFKVGRNANELADTLRSLEVPDEWTHEIVRRAIVAEGAMFTGICFSNPDEAREFLLDEIRGALDPEHHHLIDTAFSPPYLPWRERIAFVPDGDLFRCVNEGKASVVTDHIVRFTPTGIELESGEHLDADIIVTATGFNMNVLGDIDFTIDGEPLTFHDTITYHGAMFTGIPNMVWVFGYFRASWTLRADMIAEFVIRLLDHMDERGAKVVTPLLRPEDRDMQLLPWIDPENFNPGYIRRSLHLLPHQGDKLPWKSGQDYVEDRKLLADWDLEDGALTYT